MSLNMHQAPAPNAMRQTLASLVQENTSLCSRIQAVEDNNRTLHSILAELQDRDEKLQTDLEEQKLTCALLNARIIKLESGPKPVGEAEEKLLTKLSVTRGGSKEDEKKMVKIAKTTLAHLFGVVKINPKVHCVYPKVSKNHMEWPSRMDNGRRVPSVRFDFTKSYTASCNSEDFNAWVTFTIDHGPIVAGLSDVAAPIDQKRVLTACQKVYGYWKRQFNTKSREPSSWDKMDRETDSGEEGSGGSGEEDILSKGKDKAEENEDEPMSPSNPNGNIQFNPSLDDPFTFNAAAGDLSFNGESGFDNSYADLCGAGPSNHSIFMFSDPTAAAAIFSNPAPAGSVPLNYAPTSPASLGVAQPLGSAITTCGSKRLVKEKIKEKNRGKGKGKTLGDMTSALQAKGKVLTRRSLSAKRRAEAIEDKTEKGKIAQRKKGKLTTRRRRRVKLTGPDAKYKDAKYDEYFVEGAMSDDQTVLKPADEAGKRRSEPWYLTRAPAYFSDEVIAIREALDRVHDPQDTSTERRRGDPLEGIPPKRRVIHTGIRQWMVKPELLEENPDWLTEGRVFASGPEWGNPGLNPEGQPNSLIVQEEKDENEIARAQKALDAHVRNQNRDEGLDEF